MPQPLDYNSIIRRDSTSLFRSRTTVGIVGLVASIACGWQAWEFMMWQLYGAPANPLHKVALLGAVGLFFASIAVLLRNSGRAAVGCVLIAILPLWVFYGPASAAYIVGGGLFSDPVTLAPPFLLLIVTATAALNFGQRRQSELPD